MAVTYQAAGPLAALGTGASTLNVTLPTCLENDILIAVVWSHEAPDTIAPPAGWTEIREDDRGTAQHGALYWKRAITADSGDSQTWSRTGVAVVGFYGQAAAFRGGKLTGSAIDSDTASFSGNGTASDNIDYASLDPAAACHIVAIGLYRNDLTTAGAMTGTNPTFTLRIDNETATGEDASVFFYSGDSDGAATGARSHPTTSTTDAGSIGYLLGILAAPTGNVPGALHHLKMQGIA